MRFTIETRYRYDRRVSLGPHIIRLRPAPHCRTPILAYSLKVLPKNHFINWQQDPQGNYLARLVFPEPTTELFVEVDLVAEMAVYNPFDFFLEPYAEQYPFCYDPSAARELRPFLETEPAGPMLSAFLAKVPRGATRTMDFLVGLNQLVQNEIGYVIRMEPGVQTCEETLTLRTGSCRDSAWLLVQIMRHLGLAARFVSGYLIQLVADVKPLEGPAGPTADFTDLHAWTEVYLPGAGWVGFDPTSGLLAGEGHIPLACTPDAGSAAPISGLLDPCNTEFRHEMTVQRIYESPRVTKPYTDQQWQAIEKLGHQVDADLRAGDVRLTMGGEPTFVSLDDADGAEWTTAALGPVKRQRAVELLGRLRQRFAPGGLLHFGQGKWYPGEPLPRWAFGCYWRKDGVPIWEDASLIAEDGKDYGYTAEHARQFLEALTRRLQVDAGIHHRCIRGRLLLPVEGTQAAGQRRSARFQARGSDRARPSGAHFRTGPGPADRLRSSVAPHPDPFGHAALDQPALVSRLETDVSDPRRFGDGIPFAARISSLDQAGRCALFLRPGSLCEARAPSGKAGAQDATFSTRPPFRTIPCRTRTRPNRRRRANRRPGSRVPPSASKPRQGKLFVFMPPVEYLADYLDLAAAIEDTAAYLKMPVLLEGYAPPSDPRIAVLKVTPDPGVIEVNIHPAASWDELTANTTALYELARQSRLGTEKFMLDGQHSGTGGGNHVVIGGPTPEDSPFLRRPDLLRSLIGYWHNHPSLSYLLSGLFIGPTSQHPRVDEARTDAIYELEIAFDQIPDKDSPASPLWLADRVFRHLLTDLAGNTHRAEFCIDKLYSPDASGSRLGLVELRAFEMPPHAQMSLTQQLLVRALTAHFWENPYRRKLVWWGTMLHDRFMLPHFVQLDWEDVMADLREAGFEFQTEWFAPHFEFRFPQIGSVTRQGMRLELRHALEPWHVLGEEASGSGTVRNVDSSVERLQVKVAGMTGQRFVVACNGRRVPLHPTGESGEFVAGVRYRAWQPPSCLHPNIPVHTPLVFDIVDTWSGRAIGGCTYHVTHPGGRANEQFPVNAQEAESRRLARFQDTGHTPGTMVVPPEERNPEFPFTLDLRRAR